MTIATRLLLAIGLAAAAVGCSSRAEPSTPSTPSTPSSPSSPARLPTDPPRVAKQWDAGAYKDKPCALLTDQQAQGMGYRVPGSVLTVDDGIAQCRRIDGSNQFVIRFFGTDLVGRIYRREMIWPGINWATPMKVVGQPALKSALPGSDECLIAVAIADNQGFDVRIDEKGVDPCVHATQAAETVMHNLGA
ncbi:DUF3558 family protein [Kibdelosporangium lantanae]|uniref:DUF3558 family protein n=1 Tax=Kibdelosporangium lantanae TaxID=1497396 RepID=A0ABW3M2P6_9PSEU